MTAAGFGGPGRACEEVGPLLGAFALDAIDPDEAAAVDEHVRACDACTREVEGHREALAALADVDRPGPVHVWDRIHAEIARGPAVRGDNVTPIARPGRPRRSRRRTVVAAAVAAVAAAAGVAIGIQSARVAHLQDHVDALEHPGRGSGVESVAAALADPTARHLDLVSTTAPTRLLGRLVILRSGTAYLVDGRLPVLDGDRTYQVWAITGGRAISVALLGDRPAAAAFAVDPAAAASEYLVTVEPAGGVVAPTTAPVARAPV